MPCLVRSKPKTEVASQWKWCKKDNKKDVPCQWCCCARALTPRHLTLGSGECASLNNVHGSSLYDCIHGNRVTTIMYPWKQHHYNRQCTQGNNIRIFFSFWKLTNLRYYFLALHTYTRLHTRTLIQTSNLPSARPVYVHTPTRTHGYTHAHSPGHLFRLLPRWFLRSGAST